MYQYKDLINNYLAAESMDFSPELIEIVGSNKAIANELRVLKTNRSTIENLDEAIEEMAENLETHELVKAAKIEMSNPVVNLQATLDALYAQAQSDLAMEEAIESGIKQFAEEKKKGEMPATTTSALVVEMPKPQVKIISMRTFRFAAAAVLLIGLGVWLFSTQRADFDMQAYLKEERSIFKENKSISKGLDSDKSKFKQVDSLINIKEYQNALNIIKTFKEDEKDEQVQFFEGYCYENLDKFPEAILIFERILENSKKYFVDIATKERTQYNLALCYLKTDKKQKAKEILTELINTTDHKNPSLIEEANKLLIKIK